MGEYALEMAGCRVLLLAARALYWPEQQLLCIADVHFGKAAAYRAAGQPVPHGTTQDNLLRLDALLAAYPTRRLVFLGDFLHARASHAAATLSAMQAWRLRHPQLVCTLVRGNHDLRAGDPPAAMEIEVVDEPLLLRPFALCHTPAPRAGYQVIAGHVHPVFRLSGQGRQHLRLPCFQVGDGVVVLPSFGDFTGGHPVRSDPSTRIFLTEGSRVWPLPTARVPGP